MSVPGDAVMIDGAVQPGMADGVAALTAGVAQADERGVTETERKEVRRLANAWDEAQRFDRHQRKRYVRDRAYASGRADETWAVNANLIGNYIDVLCSYLYAKDPDVSVKPSASVGKARLPDIQLFSETLEIVITRLWKQGRLKRAMKRDVRSGLSVGVGWLKAAAFSHTARDPQVESALNDIRDNIARLEAQRKALETGEAPDGTPVDTDVQLAEMQRTEASLQERVEVVVRKGMVFDLVEAQDVQVSLDVRNLADYLEAEWIGDAMYVTKGALAEMFPALTADDVKRATAYYQRVQRATPLGDETSARDAYEFVTDRPPAEGEQADPVEFARVVEIWDRRDNHIKTLVSGIDRWAKQPFQPAYATSRFFPYFLLGFYWVDGERHPQSLPMRLEKLQDEYSALRSNARLTRQRSIPGVIFNRSGITPDDVKRLENGVQQEFIGIDPVNPNQPLSELFTEKPVARIDPLMFETRPAVTDMEKISGVQEALQTSVTRSKTATQAEIENEGFAARTGADRDEIEDVLQDLAQYTAELAVQCLSIEEVQRIAGAGAYWPQGLPIDDLLTLVEVEIVAASTGKPDQNRSREAWATVLPLIQSTMLQVRQARAMGDLGLAEALTELVRETLRRVGDRIDIEKFIPQGEPPPPVIPGAGAPTDGAGALPAEGAVPGAPALVQ